MSGCFEKASEVEYTGEVAGVKARAMHYYRYLQPDGKLTPFQKNLLQERRERRKLSSSRPRLQSVVVSDEEEAILKEMEETVKVNAKGFFEDPDVIERYSLRMLYRLRRRQLQLSQDPLDIQLSPSPSLESCKSIVNLDFSSSYLAPRGVLALAAVLPYCTELRSLVLSGVGIRAVKENHLHFTALMEALQSCKVLQLLDLSSNSIDDYFGMHILNMIMCHPLLSELNLERSGLCDLIVQKALRVTDKRNDERAMKQETNSSKSVPYSD